MKQGGKERGGREIEGKEKMNRTVKEGGRERGKEGEGQRQTEGWWGGGGGGEKARVYMVCVFARASLCTCV